MYNRTCRSALQHNPYGKRGWINDPSFLLLDNILMDPSISAVIIHHKEEATCGTNKVQSRLYLSFPPKLDHCNLQLAHLARWFDWSPASWRMKRINTSNEGFTSCSLIGVALCCHHPLQLQHLVLVPLQKDKYGRQFHPPSVKTWRHFHRNNLGDFEYSSDCRSIPNAPVSAAR